MNTYERDPNKRRVKPVETAQQLLDFDLGESSDDSDFRIEDHAEESEDDDSLNSQDDDNYNNGEAEESESSLSDEEAQGAIKLPHSNNVSVGELLHQAKARNADLKLQFDQKTLKMTICSGCLGDRSDDANEIVECDGCGVTVHEGCYGVSDTASVSSTVSSCSTEPWFCEACKAGVMNPQCELCPNTGGIYKETDVGKFVHLVCALYVPGVAFGEVDHLSSVTLFEMPYNKWGAKTCCLCEDERFSRTGVCIGCDAGMCKTYFHVTCAQREGLLSEAHSEEVDQADPFYAHCKLHSDKTLVRKRKRNWLALQIKTQHRRIEHEQQGHNETPEQQRIQRKLKKNRLKYATNKSLKIAPWVPTQKMPRLLTTSASACRKLLQKAHLMGIDTVALEIQDAHISTLTDIKKKWNITPAFSVEFIGYYLDRNVRVISMKKGLEQLLDVNGKLLEEQQLLRDKYDQAMKESSEQSRLNISLKKDLHKLQSSILDVCPGKTLPSVDSLGRSAPVSRPMGVPTAAALKMGVGFPLNNIPAGRGDSGRVLSTSRQETLLLNNECGICRQRNDQHLLTKCDTCHLYYHMGCLNPPLTRLPKKSKLYGWQCSECDKSSDSEPDITQPKAPRRSRTRYSKDGAIIPAPTEIIPQPKNKSRRSSKIEKIDLTDDNTDFRNSRSESGSLKVTIKPLDKNFANQEQSSDPLLPHHTSSSDLHSPSLTRQITKVKSNKKSRKEKRNSHLQESLNYFDVEAQNEAAVDTMSHIKPNIHKHKLNFTSPTLTNTPLMSITPLIAESPGKSESPSTSQFQNVSFLSQNSTFASISLASPGHSDQPMDPLALDVNPIIIHDSPHKQNRKRRKEKHRNRYSPDMLRSPSKEHKRKRKKKNQDIENPNTVTSHPRITIKIKPIPLPAGEVASITNPQMFYVPSDSNDGPPTLPQHTHIKSPKTPSTHNNSASSDLKDCTSPEFSLNSSPTTRPMSRRHSTSKLSPGTQLAKPKGRESDILTGCDVCHNPGTAQNVVRCDECKKCYHFTCLDPPLKKSPKRRGYSWHCADCDPTEPESN